jgi:transcription elongation factor SPT6
MFYALVIRSLFLQKYAGKFLLSCLPTRRSKHEYITVTPDGYRFRSQNFDSIGSLFRWYKEHFRDATPHVTPVASRSAGQTYGPSPHTGKYYIIY